MALLPLARLLWTRRQGRGGYPALVRASWLRFGVPSVVLLGVAGRWPALWRLPPEFADARALIGVDGIDAAGRLSLLGAGAIGVSVGVFAGVLVTAWRAWRGRPEGTLFGDARAVLPRPGELGWAAVVAVTAGVTEEAYFRLLLPLLTALATGSALAGFVGATLLFGAAHRYQGWRGVAATTVAGAALSAGYLATGSLVAVMAFHAVGDLGHLVVRPAVRGWIERRRSA